MKYEMVIAFRSNIAYSYSNLFINGQFSWHYLIYQLVYIENWDIFLIADINQMST